MDAERTVAEQPRQRLQPHEQKIVAGFFLSMVLAFACGAIVGWFKGEDWLSPAERAAQGGVAGLLILFTGYLLAGLAFCVVMSVRILLS